ncbi:MAG: hypothetical protein O7B25_01655 [Gammaproteobacteria bacterium]|nr:hypothetical protein [Gammaproteobacteria bacterium]
MPRSIQTPRISATARLTAVVLVVVFGLLAGGCQSTDKREMAWQALHAIDVSQTLNAASDPCYKEASFITKRLIGEQPSDAEVMVWGIAMAVTHMWVSNQLEARDAPRWVQAVWDLGTIGNTGYAVVNNHRNGVRPWGDNASYDGCYG